MMRQRTGVIVVMLWSVLGCESQPASRPPVQASQQVSPPRATGGSANKKAEFLAMRETFTSTLTSTHDPSAPPAEPPEGVFEHVQYQSPLGPMHAYVSPDPGDGKKHPIILWKFGGFSNGIGSTAWSDEPAMNDQSAAQFRKAGVLMMYPSVRGGHDNPGRFEAFYGEVDDMLAALDYARSLDYVDRDRVYLGGHSTGGSLALLTAAAVATDKKPRAVFSLGPIDWISNYGEGVQYDIYNDDEEYARAPIEWLDAIESPTFIIEGSEGNSGAARRLAKATHNPNVSTFVVPTHSHFSLIAGVNEMLARKILEDAPAKGRFKVVASELQGLVQNGQKVEAY